MRHLILATAALLVSVPALAQTAAPQPSTSTPSVAPAMSSSCKAQAADKKLAGAAMNSFMKKCVSRMRQRLAILRRGHRRNSPALQRRASPRNAWVTP